MATVRIGLGATNAQAEQLHVGDNVAVCKISLSASWSSGDIHVIGKIPNGAIPLDAVFYPGAALAATAVAKFGTSAYPRWGQGFPKWNQGLPESGMVLPRQRRRQRQGMGLFDPRAPGVYWPEPPEGRPYVTGVIPMSLSLAVEV